MAAKNKVIGIDPVPNIKFSHFIVPRGIDLSHYNYIVMMGCIILSCISRRTVTQMRFAEAGCLQSSMPVKELMWTFIYIEKSQQNN